MTPWTTTSRRTIERRAAAVGSAPVRDILASHKNDFVEWRYPGEHGKTDYLDLDLALAVLEDVCRTLMVEE